MKCGSRTAPAVSGSLPALLTPVLLIGLAHAADEPAVETLIVPEVLATGKYVFREKSGRKFRAKLKLAKDDRGTWEPVMIDRESY